MAKNNKNHDISLVLGLGSSWRRIAQSVPPHRPYSEGISIDGVLYYGAWTCEDTCVVMSFDMRSEEVTMIESPLEAGILWNTRATNIMNSRGKLAVFDYSHLERDGSIYLWVLEDGAGKRLWSNKKTFALPIVGIRLIFGGELFVRGTSREGKIRFFVNDYSSWHVICDLESCEMISGVQSSILLKRPFEAESFHTNYWDDFESIMYLEA